MLNVAAGGSLYQDVADQLPGALKHDYTPDYPRSLTPHHVEITPGSRLAAILTDVDPAVNSTHHQGVRVPAHGFAVVARAPDGLIEGIEHPDHPFALGVQWHPEDLIDHDPRMRRLLEAFVEAAMLGRAKLRATPETLHTRR
jgi:putative glutamine amidotransferase